MNAGVILFLIFAVCVLIGVPISMSLGIGSLAAVALGNLGVSPAVIAQRVFGGLQSTSIMAIAFFILTVNLTNYAVTYCGHSVEMPPKELELLYFLASSPNQVFTREQLLDHIWGYEYIGDTRTVDVHIKRLREKIKDHANWALTTVWGIGYKFEVRK